MENEIGYEYAHKDNDKRNNSSIFKLQAVEFDEGCVKFFHIYDLLLAKNDKTIIFMIRW